MLTQTHNAFQNTNIHKDPIHVKEKQISELHEYSNIFPVQEFFSELPQSPMEHFVLTDFAFSESIHPDLYIPYHQMQLPALPGLSIDISTITDPATTNTSTMTFNSWYELSLLGINARTIEQAHQYATEGQVTTPSHNLDGTSPTPQSADQHLQLTSNIGDVMDQPIDFTLGGTAEGRNVEGNKLYAGRTHDDDTADGNGDMSDEGDEDKSATNNQALINAALNDKLTGSLNKAEAKLFKELTKEVTRQMDEEHKHKTHPLTIA